MLAPPPLDNPCDTHAQVALLTAHPRNGVCPQVVLALHTNEAALRPPLLTAAVPVSVNGSVAAIWTIRILL